MIAKDTKRYLRQIRSWLPCSRKLKKEILLKIEGNVSDWLEEHPDAGYDAIVARFGTPQQIASAYVDEMDTAELLKLLRVRRNIVRIVAIMAIAIVMLWFNGITISLVESITTNGGYSVVITTDEDTGVEFIEEIFQ